MQQSKLALVVPILIITVGVGWLLTTHNVIPGVNWVWILGMGMAGVLTLAISGIDKVSIVAGPLLIAATFFSLLRQTHRLSVDTEVPCMVIVAGVLMLVSALLPVRGPRWLVEQDKRDSSRGEGE